MKLYAGIDLHASNNYIGVIDDNDNRLLSKKVNNDMVTVLEALAPFKENIEGVIVESTYNWYWLVDGLQEEGYHVHLANPAQIQQYNGKKYTDDKWDSFWLAHMKRLNILPEGYIYPKENRPVRDLLRRRMMYVRQKTSHILSLESMINRNCGLHISNKDIKKLTDADLGTMFEHRSLIYAAKSNLETIRFFDEKIKGIEKEIVSQAELDKDFELLQTMPGVGKILSLTIMLEVGDITRFARVNNYSSYCCCVKSERLSNNKKKGANNSKNGNRYLAWAYIEAAIFAINWYPEIKRYYQKKLAKTNRFVAVKTIAHKLARASYFIMRDKVPFDIKKLFF